MYFTKETKLKDLSSVFFNSESASIAFSVKGNATPGA